MVCINVRVDERLKRELEAEAQERGVRPSDIVRQALARIIQTGSNKETSGCV
jgi:antitoxin component of RelBE/YafQ-DinJ toxin-antitoxin module